jgi:predicted XRE-type DNA-binding protein
MQTSNKDIRQEIKQSHLKMWNVAEKLGIQDSYFSRMLRHELPPDEKDKIRTAITELKEGE